MNDKPSGGGAVDRAPCRVRSAACCVCRARDRRASGVKLGYLAPSVVAEMFVADTKMGAGTVDLADVEEALERGEGAMDPETTARLAQLAAGRPPATVPMAATA